LTSSGFKQLCGTHRYDKSGKLISSRYYANGQRISPHTYHAAKEYCFVRGGRLECLSIDVKTLGDGQTIQRNYATVTA